MRRFVSAAMAAALVVAPVGAEAADLVVWWEKGYYDQEDPAVREIIAAIEQDTGKRIDRIHRVAAAVRKVHGAGSGGGADLARSSNGKGWSICSAG
jgi:spermidine/putrescine-binding protein